MKQFYFFSRLGGTLLLVLLAAFSYAADVVTLHSPGPGRLSLSDEAYVATRLRVTGNIDARDFLTLKKVTLNRTHELDLSGAAISAYAGSDGCYVPKASDWIVEDGIYYHQYPANTIPVHAFTELRDNSIRKWYEGSSTLTRLILPPTIVGIEDGAFLNVKHLAELEVPPSSLSARSIDNAVYSNDLTRLVGVAPAYTGELNIPGLVTHINAGVLNGLVLTRIRFNSTVSPTFGPNNTPTVGYIIVPSLLGAYTEILPAVDRLTELKMLTLNDVAEGTVTDRLGRLDITREEVRSLRVTGNLTDSDIMFLLNLPNLHHLDLFEAQTSATSLYLSAQSLCSVQLPQGTYDLTVPSNKCLSGNLVVPEGVMSLKCRNVYFTSVTLPSTLQYLESESFNESRIQHADFSACKKLTELSGFSYCPQLEELLLPPRLKKLHGISDAKISRMELPETLEEFTGCTGWQIEELRLPASLRMIDQVDNMMELRKIDASSATSLTTISAFSDCPRLEIVNLSVCPLTKLSGFDASMLTLDKNKTLRQQGFPSTRIVVSGRTGYPAIAFSRLKSLTLPTCLTSIDGLNNCESLATFSLFDCNLTRLEGLQNALSLTSLSLPSSLRQMSRLEGCTALQSVTCATLTPPAFTQLPGEGQFASATLIVPNACQGAYRMSEGWSKFKEIKEGGYLVTLKADRIGGFNLKGSGLYPAGTVVKLSASASVPYSKLQNHEFRAWEVNGEFVNNPSLTFLPGGHTVATAYYDYGHPDLSKGDICFELSVTNATTHVLGLTPATGSLTLYDVNGVVAKVTAYTEISLPLTAGKHSFAISGEVETCELNQDLYGENNSKTLDNLVFNNASSLFYLSVMNLHLTNLDVSSLENVTALDCSFNQFTQLDLSQLPNLGYLNCQDNNLTALDVSGLRNLYGLYCGSNHIVELDLSNSSQLISLDCSGNSLKTLDVTGNTKLEYLDCDDNHFAFSSMTPQMYNLMIQNAGEQIYAGYKLLQKEVTFDCPLDLSSELYDYSGNTPTVLKIIPYSCSSPTETSKGIYSFSSEGRYEGYYEVEMTNASMPRLLFGTTFCVNTTSDLTTLPLEGMRLELQHHSINISGLPDGTSVDLLTIGGSLISTSTSDTTQFTVPSAGIYILHFTQGNRRSALKLYVKD